MCATTSGVGEGVGLLRENIEPRLRVREFFGKETGFGCCRVHGRDVVLGRKGRKVDSWHVEVLRGRATAGRTAPRTKPSIC